MRYLLIHCPGNEAPVHPDLPSDLEASLNSWLEETIADGTNLGSIEIRPIAGQN